MKILTIGYSWWGQWLESLNNSFIKLGHISKIHYLIKNFDFSLSRIFYSYNKYKFKIKEYNHKKLYQLLKQEKFDLIIVFNADIMEEKILSLLKKQKTKAFLWLGDDPFIVDQAIETLHLYDKIFSWDPYYVPVLNSLTNKKNYYLPAAGDENIYYDQKLKDQQKTVDISFVGSAFGPNKILRPKTVSNLLNSLGRQAENLNIEIYGDNNWLKFKDENNLIKKVFKNKILTCQETNELYNRSKIVLNLQHPQNVLATNLRTFEIALTNTFQIANFKEETKNIYGDLIANFTNIDELKNYVLAYLSNPQNFKEKTNKAYEITIKNHTYLNRAKEILSY